MRRGFVDALDRYIENFCMIKMVVARASGMDLASILKRNTFLTLGVRPAGVRAGRGDTGGPGTGGHGGPGTGGHGGARDGVPITSRPSVPGRLKFGGEIGGAIGSEIGGVGYGAFSLQGPDPGTKKHLQKHHYQTPPLSPAKSQSPGGGF